jgi:hypothetical protein
MLAETRTPVEPVHRAAIDALPQEFRNIAGYHAGWWDADGRPASSTGKAVRDRHGQMAGLWLGSDEAVSRIARERCWAAGRDRGAHGGGGAAVPAGQGAYGGLPNGYGT